MALLTSTPLAIAGIDIAGVAPTATTGDTWANTGNDYVIIKNGSGGSINVTLDVKADLDGNAAVDPVVAVAAGATKIIGPFKPRIYNDDGLAKVVCSAVSSVTIKIVKAVPS